MKINFIKALSIPEAWWMSIRDLFENGYTYTIQRGSFEGEQRLEFDLAVIQITNPSIRPLIPEVPMGAPPPTSQEYVDEYLSYLMTDNKQPEEEYCYSSDTEILTTSGWKKFTELIQGIDRVATLNPKTNEIVYQLPDHYFNKPYNGKIRNINSKFIDLLVTKNHKLYTAPYMTQDFSLSDNLPDKPVRFKRDALWVGRDNPIFVLPAVHYDNYRYAKFGKEKQLPMNDWLSFLGIWMAEGSLRKNSYTVVITQTNDIHRTIILSMVRKIFGNAIEYGKDILINDKQLWTYLSQLNNGSHNKSIPIEFMDLSSDYLKHLLFWMCFGDGTKCKGSYSMYSTVSKKLADQVQEIALKVGMPGSIRKEQLKTGEIYRVSLSSKTGLQPHVLPSSITDVDYSGNIVCVHVPLYNILYVRRNGKPCWSGNTYGWYLEPQISKVINMLKDSPNTNQSFMTVGDPSTLDMNDPPCLRGIQARVRYGALHFIVYFRSWDLYGGFPSNLAGIQLMKEYMAKEIGVEDGELECISGGLHLYEHTWNFAKTVIKTNV